MYENEPDPKEDTDSPPPAGPHADTMRGHIGGGANYDDEHIPAPAGPAQQLEATQTDDDQLVIAVDLEDARGQWIVCDSPVDVREAV